MSDIFKEVLPAILQTKQHVITKDNERDYNPFVVNRALSFHYDCVMLVNEMNKLPDTDNLLQFQYLLNTIRSYKRPFQKWQKREDTDGLNAVKEYFGYSNEKAREAINILSDDQLNEIKRLTNKGGVNNAKSNRKSVGGDTR
jgi:hypothetical protein